MNIRAAVEGKPLAGSTSVRGSATDLSIYISTYIAPFKVTTQRRSLPRVDQRAESWRVYKKNWKGDWWLFHLLC